MGVGDAGTDQAGGVSELEGRKLAEGGSFDVRSDGGRSHYTHCHWLHGGGAPPDWLLCPLRRLANPGDVSDVWFFLCQLQENIPSLAVTLGSHLASRFPNHQRALISRNQQHLFWFLIAESQQLCACVCDMQHLEKKHSAAVGFQRGNE